MAYLSNKIGLKSEAQQMASDLTGQPVSGAKRVRRMEEPNIMRSDHRACNILADDTLKAYPTRFSIQPQLPKAREAI